MTAEAVGAASGRRGHFLAFGGAALWGTLSLSVGLSARVVVGGDGCFLRRALRAYGYAEGALDGALPRRLMAYALLHRYSNLRWYLDRLSAPGATSLDALAARLGLAAQDPSNP